MRYDIRRKLDATIGAGEARGSSGGELAKGKCSAGKLSPSLPLLHGHGRLARKKTVTWHDLIGGWGTLDWRCSRWTFY
jgi:hypothetical protein